MPAGHPRVNCVIPGCCRGTTRIEPIGDGFCDWDTGTGRREFICARHWKPVPRAWKRRRNLFWRMARKAWPAGLEWAELTEAQQQRYLTASRCAKKMWKRMKAHAESPLSSVPEQASIEEVERAFGIV